MTLDDGAYRQSRTWPAWLSATAVVLLIGGCTVTFGNGDASQRVGSAGDPRLVEDQTAVLDLRQRPERETLGFVPGSTAAIYERELDSPGIRTTVLLPRGQVVLLAFGIHSDTTDLDTVRSRAEEMSAPPERTVVNTRYASVAEARTALGDQAQALGLVGEDIEQAVGGRLQELVLDGATYDFMEMWVETRAPVAPGDSVVVDYTFRYRN